MATEQGFRGSIWLDDPLAETPPLARDATCDVCVVGGGIAGLLIADRLTREGQSVVLLDQGRFCGGETGRTTAHFSAALDDRFSNIERMHGHAGARMRECVRLSAVCPHLGGVVRWNGAEKTWDCPCHASRFDRYGKMLHGPANVDLDVER